MPSWTLALEGARKELAALEGERRRKRALQIGYLAVREILYTVKLIPFAVRAATARMRLTQKQLTIPLPLPLPLPQFEKKKEKREKKDVVRLIRDVKYDREANCKMDIYTPVTTLKERERGSENENEMEKKSNREKQLPVLLFVHGGVWSSGELWHYSSLGDDLAKEGVVVAVATYPFYPQVNVTQQVTYVNSALSFVHNRIEEFGGDPTKVTFAGHSSGAHLAMMSVLARAGLLEKGRERERSESSKASSPEEMDEKKRMPKSVVLMAGVYDIFKHYQYEYQRGVHSLSAMERAMGGTSEMGKLSPARILDDHANDQNAPAKRNAEAILREIEGKEKRRKELRRNAGEHESLSSSTGSTEDEDSTGLNVASSSSSPLPPIYLMSGLEDDVVPWYWSSEFFEILGDRGLAAESTVYDTATHLDFISCFNRGEHVRTDLARIRSDLLRVVTGKGRR